MLRQGGIALVLMVLLMCLAGCAAAAPPPAATPGLAPELVFYDWEEDVPQGVLEAFSREYGVRVSYLTYLSTEEAVANIRAGRVYDVVVLENRFVPALVGDGLLARIDHRNVPNFSNISPNFRDLAYDPGKE